MADTGWLAPGTCSDTGSSWANPSNASAADGNSTVAAITGRNVPGSTLLLSNFGASIPDGMQITNFEVAVTGSQTYSTNVFTPMGGTVLPSKIVGTAPSSFTNALQVHLMMFSAISLAAMTIDGVNLTSWTPADFNASTFGLRVIAPSTSDNSPTGGTVTTSIDQLRIRITYDYPKLDVGPNNPSTSATSGGTTSWATPANANASDNVYTTHTTSTTAANMPYLNSTGFGFAIPAGSTINGITAVVEKKYTGGSSGNVRDDTVQLLKAGSRVGTNKAVTGTNWSTTDTNVTYGATNDLWGTTWTPAEINASNFGVALRAVGNGTGANRVANVDNIRVSVNYTLAAGTTPTIVQKNIYTGVGTTLSSPTTAGNTMLVIATYDPNGGTSSITDSKGNAVGSKVLDYGTTVTKFSAWLYPITTGGSSHTVSGSFGGYTGFATISVYELSGAVDLDTAVTATAYDTSSPYAVTTGAPTVANNLLMGILASEGSDNVTFSATGWTKQNEFADFSSYWGQSNFTKVGGSTAETFSATMTTNSPEIVAVIGLKTASNDITGAYTASSTSDATYASAVDISGAYTSSSTSTASYSATLDVPGAYAATSTSDASYVGAVDGTDPTGSYTAASTSTAAYSATVDVPGAYTSASTSSASYTATADFVGAYAAISASSASYTAAVDVAAAYVASSSSSATYTGTTGNPVVEIPRGDYALRVSEYKGPSTTEKFVREREELLKATREAIYGKPVEEVEEALEDAAEDIQDSINALALEAAEQELISAMFAAEIERMKAELVALAQHMQVEAEYKEMEALMMQLFQRTRRGPFWFLQG